MRLHDGRGLYTAIGNMHPTLLKPQYGTGNVSILSMRILGEYVYVSGTADQDGFYIGETTDGRRGLVPGNYLELVPNLNAPPYRMRDNELHSGSPLTDLANQNNQNQGHVTGHVVSHVGIQQPSASPILSRCMEMFELDGKVIVPFPRQLRVDKRLSHSLLISWLPPRLSGEERIIKKLCSKSRF